MARQTNETSIRQQAFAELDKMTGVGRKDAAQALMSKFGIGSAYAMTIYQQHRNDMKTAGKLHTVYSIKESETGPSVVTSHVLNVNDNDATSPEAAVKAYVESLNAKIAGVKKIDVKAIKAAEKAEADALVAAEKAKAEKAAAAEKAKADKAAEKAAKAEARAQAKAEKAAEAAKKAAEAAAAATTSTEATGDTSAEG